MDPKNLVLPMIAAIDLLNLLIAVAGRAEEMGLVIIRQAHLEPVGFSPE